MTLEDFFEHYGWNACITIDNADGERLCEERCYSGDDEECSIADESWWKEYKDCEIKFWNIIGGDGYPVEIMIDLRPINWDGYERGADGLIILESNG
jgi:hypothetical protein